MSAPPPAVLAAIVAGAELPADPDTRLAALGRDLLAAWAAQVRNDIADARDLSEDAGDRADAAYDRVGVIVDAIEVLTAEGQSGLLVKALAACWCVSADLPPDVAKVDYGASDMILLAQVRRLVLALDAGGRLGQARA